MKIYCCSCGVDVDARLTDGGEIYPHRADLKSLPFWRCNACGNFVGCHHKTKNRTQPLGCIPTPEIKDARKHIHALLDPIWQSGRIGRREAYNMMKTMPAREDGYSCWYQPVPQGTRGAWPCTYVREAYHDDRYEVARLTTPTTKEQ